MSTLLTPAPELRPKTTTPALGEISPEVENGRLHGAVTPYTNDTVPKLEKAWHALAAKCLALKMNYSETAAFCGVDKASVQNIVKAPFFVARLRAELDKVTTPLTELFGNSGVSAYHKIVQLMETSKSDSIQLACAKEIIERNLGKANQPIEHRNSEASGDVVERYNQLMNENAALRKQLPN